MVRLFVAVTLSEASVARLTRLQAGLPGARWVAPENLHCTLRFLGEVEAPMQGPIEDALAGVRMPPFELAVRGIGWFPERKPPKVLWAGLEPPEPLVRLHRRVEGALRRLALPRPRAQRFLPHVTVARLRDVPMKRFAEYARDHHELAAEPFGVDEFVLFSSTLKPAGSEYRREAIFPLRG